MFFVNVLIRSSLLSFCFGLLLSSNVVAQDAYYYGIYILPNLAFS